MERSPEILPADPRSLVPPHLSVEPHPAAADTEVVLAGLRDFNERHLGPTERVPIGVFVRDAEGRVLGGLVGMVKFAWLHVDWFWLPDALRGQGIGRALLAAAESDAQHRGCIGAHLDTADHQALPFYQKQGYVVFGMLDDNPVGSRSWYLQKRW